MPPPTARQNWPKFGICASAPDGPDSGVTYQSKEDIYIEWTSEQDNTEATATAEQEEHALRREAARQVDAQLRMERLRQRLSARKNNPVPSSSTAMKKGKYVPPARRTDADVNASAQQDWVWYPPERKRRNEVKISNLSLQASEADVEELCTKFGPITRVHVSRDRSTGRAKGHAYVTFDSDTHAEKCVRMLDRYGYDHLILSVTWAD